MSADHAVTVETPYQSQHVAACESCSWRMVLDHGRPTWIDHGDVTAHHAWSVGPIELSTTIKT